MNSTLQKLLLEAQLEAARSAVDDPATYSEDIILENFARLILNEALKVCDHEIDEVESWQRRTSSFKDKERYQFGAQTAFEIKRKLIDIAYN